MIGEQQAKQCRSCGLIKDMDDFYKNSSSSDGRRSTCKVCYNRSRRASGTIGTVDERDTRNDESSLGNTPLTEAGEAVGTFGTELTLVLPESEGDSNLMLEKTSLCPGCCKYNVLWLRHLVAPGAFIPIGICNDCLLQVDNELVNFYESDGILYIVRAAQTAHLSNLM